VLRLLMRRVLMLCWAVPAAMVTLVVAATSAASPGLRAVVSQHTVSLGSYEEERTIGDQGVAGALLVAPYAGGWLQFFGGGSHHLARVSETGTVLIEALPSRFRGANATDVEFVPLHGGWGLLTGRYWPGGTSEQDECSRGIEEPPGLRCGELIVSQRSPAASWTAVQALPHSFGRDAESAAPVEVHAQVELAWWEHEDGPFRIAAARPGMPFSRPKKVQDLPETPHEGTETVSLLTFDGQLYIRGRYVVEGNKTTHFVVLRRVLEDGRLGRPVVFHEGVIEEPFEPGDGFEGANGSELLPVEPCPARENLCTLAIRRRAAGSGVYEAPRLVMKHLESNIGPAGSYAQSQNHRTLVTLKQATARGVVLSSVEISAQGRVGPIRPVERVAPGPGEEGQGYIWQGAVSNAGTALVVTTPNVPTEPIWLHPAGAKCPSFGRRTAISHGDVLGVIAGHNGTFHIAWADAKGELAITSARVTCSTSASTGHPQ
jgi:hypothetical protein